MRYNAVVARYSTLARLSQIADLDWITAPAATPNTRPTIPGSEDKEPMRFPPPPPRIRGGL